MIGALTGSQIGPRQLGFPPNIRVSDCAGKYDTRYSWPPPAYVRVLRMVAAESADFQNTLVVFSR
jgi:hypothetical protein